MDQLALVALYFFGFSGLSNINLFIKVVSNALELATLIVFLSKNIDQLVSVDILVDLKLFDLVF